MYYYILKRNAESTTSYYYTDTLSICIPYPLFFFSISKVIFFSSTVIYFTKNTPHSIQLVNV